MFAHVPALSLMSTRSGYSVGTGMLSPQRTCAGLKSPLRAASRASSMLVPFWTIRVLLIILLWPVADLVRMTAVTLAGLMILMRPYIQFFYIASFVAFCAMWYKIIGGHFQPAGAFAFWSVALGAIPAIWDVLLGFIAPNMDLNTVNG